MTEAAKTTGIAELINKHAEPDDLFYSALSCDSWPSDEFLASVMDVAIRRKLSGAVGRVTVVVDGTFIKRGIFWEWLLLGREHKLDNLTAVVLYRAPEDDERHLHPINLRQIGMYVGWAAANVNASDTISLSDTLDFALTVSTPTLIIATQ